MRHSIIRNYWICLSVLQFWTSLALWNQNHIKDSKLVSDLIASSANSVTYVLPIAVAAAVVVGQKTKSSNLGQILNANERSRSRMFVREYLIGMVLLGATASVSVITISIATHQFPQFTQSAILIVLLNTTLLALFAASAFSIGWAFQGKYIAILMLIISYLFLLTLSYEFVHIPIGANIGTSIISRFDLSETASIALILFGFSTLFFSANYIHQFHQKIAFIALAITSLSLVLYIPKSPYTNPFTSHPLNCTMGHTQICVPIELTPALQDKAHSLDRVLITLEISGIKLSKLIFDNQYGIESNGIAHSSIIFVGKRFVSDQSNFQTLIDISIPQNRCTQKLSRHEQLMFSELQFQFAEAVLKNAKSENSNTDTNEVNSAELITTINQSWQRLQHCSTTTTTTTTTK